jgi:8-oxo-dGTP diphosphatase
MRGEEMAETVAFRKFYCFVDVAIFTAVGDRLSVLLIDRDREPDKGRPALPGGAIDDAGDADLDAAARRVLRTKAGVDGFFLEQLQTFGDRERDERGWSISVAYYALVPFEQLPADGAFRLADADKLPRLAFDHDRIVASGLERLRAKAAYSTLPAHLLGEKFTLPELQRAYEVIMAGDKNARRLHAASFRRKILELDVLIPLDEHRPHGGRVSGRGGQLYRLKEPLALFDSTI